MAKMYRVKFNFIFDEENPVPCEFVVEADHFFEAQIEGMQRMSDFMELCSVSEVDE